MTLPEVLAAAATRFGCLTADELAVLAAHPHARLRPCLVRCGSCRFIAGAQDVKHLIAIISTDGRDYVRNVSLYEGRD